jgi:hypothetical protein
MRKKRRNVGWAKRSVPIIPPRIPVLRPRTEAPASVRPLRKLRFLRPDRCGDADLSTCAPPLCGADKFRGVSPRCEPERKQSFGERSAQAGAWARVRTRAPKPERLCKYSLLHSNTATHVGWAKQRVPIDQQLTHGRRWARCALPILQGIFSQSPELGRQEVGGSRSAPDAVGSKWCNMLPGANTPRYCPKGPTRNVPC